MTDKLKKKARAPQKKESSMSYQAALNQLRKAVALPQLLVADLKAKGIPAFIDETGAIRISAEQLSALHALAQKRAGRKQP